MKPGCFLLIFIFMFSCDRKEELISPQLEGFSLYWDHEVFGSGGRRLRFALYSVKKYDHQFALQFHTSIEGKTIRVVMTDAIDKGKCPYFPMPVIGEDDPEKCHSKGGFSLSDKQLAQGDYTLKIITPEFESTNILKVSEEVVSLEIPSDGFLTSSIKNVYPIPVNILMGTIVYKGAQHTEDVNKFIAHLEKLGLEPAILRENAYRHFTSYEGENYIDRKQWDPDNYSVSFNQKLKQTSFKTVFAEAEKFFTESSLNTYLYTSNGDEGRLTEEGIRVVYAGD